MNVATVPDDHRLADGVAGTLATQFPQVLTWQALRFNQLVLGVTRPEPRAVLARRLADAPRPLRPLTRLLRRPRRVAPPTDPLDGRPLAGRVDHRPDDRRVRRPRRPPRRGLPPDQALAAPYPRLDSRRVAKLILPAVRARLSRCRRAVGRCRRRHDDRNDHVHGLDRNDDHRDDHGPDPDAASTAGRDRGRRDGRRRRRRRADARSGCRRGAPHVLEAARPRRRQAPLSPDSRPARRGRLHSHRRCARPPGGTRDCRAAQGARPRQEDPRLHRVRGQEGRSRGRRRPAPAPEPAPHADEGSPRGASRPAAGLPCGDQER